MKKYPYFICFVPILSDEDIMGVSKIISDKLVGGLPFGGLEDHIYEEVPAVYIKESILGFELVIQGYGGEEGYVLEVRSYSRNNKLYDDKEITVDITKYIASLLEGTEKIKIIYEEISAQEYMDVTE
ncbi:hypothetical protein [Paenibacillus bovis]|uniref:Uncharacterized protein n=1 Tax=Paenibacillus bovis TaxID=1616788 RepID=A0A172ZE98_9BACL|nr:hypothetical protein [Paenibacillus bovis]ANF95587.1 hypothetical protein AR543_05925 [Paenibacillus bovis]